MLKLSNIKKTYGAVDNRVEALKGVSIDFRKSEFVSILGPSGCGKTTLLNIIGGLDRYSSGDIVINGVSTKDYKDRDWDTYRNHRIGFVFQSYNLIPHLTVLENVEMALTLGGFTKKERKAKSIETLKTVGLGNQLNKRPNQMSGGQMQRVAIARALVNDPEIILADEPTGALDSATSIQIMEILKKVAENRLVIMVTHNGELAEQYSTRIITLFDGEKVSDTMPYDYNVESDNKEKNTKNKQKNAGFLSKKSKQIEKTDKKSKMKFFTALYVSFKNLLSKKGRTILTSVAGSIGIIGIALVLAINNGFSLYISNLESEALIGYPMSVSAISVDYDAFANVGHEEEIVATNDTTATVYNPALKFVQYGHYNYMGADIVGCIKDFEEEDLLKEENDRALRNVKYNYFTPLKVISKSATNQYQFYMSQNKTSVMTGTTNDIFYEGYEDKDFVLEQYDVIYGTYPEEQDGVVNTKLVLVVGEGNQISFTILNALGIATPINVETSTYEEISFEDVCNAQLKLVYNDDYYIPNNANFDDITAFSKVNVNDPTEGQSNMQNVYNLSSTLLLNVDCVLRPKADSDASLLTEGLMYSPSLGANYRTNCENSLIGRKQRANSASGNFYDNLIIQVAEISLLNPNGYASVSEINEFLNLSYGFALSTEEAFELGMQQIGISTLPTSISMYVNDFDGKVEIQNLIKDFNKTTAGIAHPIKLSDSSSFLTSTLGKLIDIISYVLIAFAGISLIVSAIMISIISYVSVIERTKEIGVLRSLGARKKDISTMFNSETFIIGSASGILGVAITYLLSIPINAIVNSASSNAVANIAQLNPLHGLIMIAISVIVTLVAGLIPARIASKKDPVVALRTE